MGRSECFLSNSSLTLFLPNASKKTGKKHKLQDSAECLLPRQRCVEKSNLSKRHVRPYEHQSAESIEIFLESSRDGRASNAY